MPKRGRFTGGRGDLRALTGTGAPEGPYLPEQLCDPDALMKGDYCDYPPRIAPDVGITEQYDGQPPAFTIGSASVGRYLLLRTVEYRVIRLLGQGLTPAAVCIEFRRLYGGTLQLATLTRFLTQLDESGILAGERVESYYPEQRLITQFYTRFRLFNPDPLFARLVSVLRWVWTTQFFVASLLLMMAATLLALLNGPEDRTVRQLHSA